MIFLNDIQNIGSGTIKDVYQHPQHHNQIIKIIKPSLVTHDGGFLKHGKFKRHVQQGIYRQFRRELLQYLQLCKTHYASGQFIFPVETPYGLVATDQGLGLVTEKITAPDGKGWTLEDLARDTLLQPKHYQTLQQFFDDCVRLHIVFGEVNIAGLMYTEQRSGRPEFVLVDGIGEKLLIPIRAMSAWVSARYVRKVQQRILQQVALLQAQHSAQN
jgi:hypothetical protein